MRPIPVVVAAAAPAAAADTLSAPALHVSCTHSPATCCAAQPHLQRQDELLEEAAGLPLRQAPRPLHKLLQVAATHILHHNRQVLRQAHVELTAV